MCSDISSISTIKIGRGHNITEHYIIDMYLYPGQDDVTASIFVEQLIDKLVHVTEFELAVSVHDLQLPVVVIERL